MEHKALSRCVAVAAIQAVDACARDLLFAGWLVCCRFILLLASAPHACGQAQQLKRPHTRKWHTVFWFSCWRLWCTAPLHPQDTRLTAAVTRSRGGHSSSALW